MTRSRLLPIALAALAFWLTAGLTQGTLRELGPALLPRALAGRRWVDVFAPEEDTLIGGRATVSGVLRRLPVALLEAR